MKFCLDANALISSWYRDYPKTVFPSLWNKLVEIKSRIVLIKPIYYEIEPVISADNKLPVVEKKRKYPLRMWLAENGFESELVKIDDKINNASLLLEKEYEITTASKGANQNDVTLIAYAQITNNTVVTLEAKQPNKPDKISNYKIPLICEEQDVKCINFIDMLEKLKIRL